MNARWRAIALIPTPGACSRQCWYVHAEQLHPAAASRATPPFSSVCSVRDAGSTTGSAAPRSRSGGSCRA
eukprot:2486181-Pleurochrysis_carterae.AAC.2